MKRKIHGSTDVTSHFIEQAWVIATATTEHPKKILLTRIQQKKDPRRNSPVKQTERPKTKIELNLNRIKLSSNGHNRPKIRKPINQPNKKPTKDKT